MSSRTTARHRKATRALTPLDDFAPTARRGLAVAATSGLALTMIASGATAAGTATEVGSSAGSLEASGVGALAASAREAVATNAAVTVADNVQWATDATTQVQAVAPVVEEPEPEVGEATQATDAVATEAEAVTEPQEEVVTEEAVATQEQVEETTAESVSAPATETTTTTTDVAPSAASTSSVVAIAMQYVGTPYVWGGSSPSGFDCSGFTSYVYSQVGISLPRTSGAQGASGYAVSAAEAQPGDLLYWPGHVAIYAGDGMLIEAANPGTGVVYRQIWGSPTYIRLG
ncbi:peptidoglycan endopeptidase [Actinomyces lilanjuaniae]|uniref:Peptidoglycan endopeptidase n=1 Tax=Actinomyces lilanjuaniae TaxID=2321394 RepID=A0ABN5PT73_9ACTO|nr:C40 family peptidase [Actinomyces lilanjuaniae]AYD90452.1 peptidoglycan endopeptidase [Actinomyces lilanjuaniae]